MNIDDGRIMKYDPVDGSLILNQSIAPLTGSGGDYYMNGYCLAVQNLGGGEYRLINWTTIGSANNFEDRVISNTTYARSSLPSRIDWETGIGAVVSNVDRGDIRWGQRIRAYDLTTGQELWDKIVEAPQFSGSAVLADHGKVVIGSMYGHFEAYDLHTGDFVWQTETMEYPWDITGWGSYGMISCYGNFYWGAPASYYAFSWETGETVWQFQIPAEFPFETAYGTGNTAENSETVYPFHAPGIRMSSPALADNRIELQAPAPEALDGAGSPQCIVFFRRRADLGSIPEAAWKGKVIAQCRKQGVWLSRAVQLHVPVDPRKNQGAGVSNSDFDRSRLGNELLFGREN
jgi:hypothetical protein